MIMRMTVGGGGMGGNDGKENGEDVGEGPGEGVVRNAGVINQLTGP